MTSYDEKLLASAPKATKAQLQDGYNPDILIEKKPTPKTPKTIVVVDPEAAKRDQTPVQREESSSLITEKKRPFYTTMKGIIIIAIVVIAIIIAAVVGGVVGSRNSKAQNDVVPSSSSGNSFLPVSTGTSEPSNSVSGQIKATTLSTAVGGEGAPTQFATHTTVT